MANLRLHRHGAPPLEVSHDRVLVGRDPSCDLVIDDKSVSRRHAYFERRGSGWGVLDQGSANGTFLNGAQISDADLYDGQELRLGMVPLRVEIEGAMAGTMLMGGGGAAAQGTVMMPSGGLPPMAPQSPPPMAAPAAAWGAQPAYAPAPQPAYAPQPPQAYAPPAPAYAPPPPAQAATPQEEAAALLGVTPYASPEEVKARYTEMAADVETRISNARTPHLKSTYERNLEELRKAAELLSPGFTTVDVADLPAAAPTVIPDELDLSLPVPVRMAIQDKPPDVAQNTSGLPPVLTTVLGFVGMGALAMWAFFGLSAGKLRKELIKKEEAPEIAKIRADAALYKSVEELAAAKVLENGTLKLCNKGTQTYDVTFMGSVFAFTNPDTGETTLRAFNSLFCGANDFKISIPPGGEATVNAKGANAKCQWDGKGLFYAIAFQHPADPEQNIRISGPLHNRTDCIPIGEGW
jgi:pSer/pThr/pTyr-binding forkhead associated (FHA) protein